MTPIDRTSPLRRLTAAVLLAALPMVAVGCGGTGEVSGKVTYRGRPLDRGGVQFQTESGVVFAAEIGPDGSYSVAGLPPGAAKVVVMCYDSLVITRPAQATPATESARQKVQPKAKRTGGDTNKVPAKYGDFARSGLTCGVRSGSQTHNIELD